MIGGAAASSLSSLSSSVDGGGAAAATVPLLSAAPAGSAVGLGVVRSSGGVAGLTAASGVLLSRGDGAGACGGEPATAAGRGFGGGADTVGGGAAGDPWRWPPCGWWLILAMFVLFTDGDAAGW